MVAISLSKVTTRGVETICASDEEFRKEMTALKPSAFKKPSGPKPPTVLAITEGLAKTPLTKPGWAGWAPLIVVTPLTVVAVPGVAAVGWTMKVELFPKETC